MVFSRSSRGSSSITIRPGSTTAMVKPINFAKGGGGNRPSRISSIASMPESPIAAFATGAGTCQSTTRLTPLRGRKQVELIVTGHGGLFV